jgi:hypothetical protein
MLPWLVTSTLDPRFRRRDDNSGRQIFPRGTDLSRRGADELAAVSFALNSRLRKTLKWRTPAEALIDHLLTSSATEISRPP